MKFCVGGGKVTVKARDKCIPAASLPSVFITCLQFGVPYRGKRTKFFAEFICRILKRKNTRNCSQTRKQDSALRNIRNNAEEIK